jgi:hypothetical protein
MDQQGKSSPRFAICINNSEYPASLELFKIYQVLPNEDAAQDGDFASLTRAGKITYILRRILC